MHIVWNKYIKTHYMWEAECFGLFYKRENGIAFFYIDGLNLMAISENDTVADILYSCSATDDLSLPFDWIIVEEAEEAILMTSQNAGYDLKRNVFIHEIPASVKAAYSSQERPEKFLVEAPFHFGEYTISHKGNWGYVCTKNGQKIWEFAGRAYLYTDIVRWNDRLFFGTAGHGGYFYVLDLKTGEPITSIKTGGTRSLAHADDICYVLSNEKTAQLLGVDLSSGKIVSRCVLPGKSSSNSRVAIDGNRIHAITYEYSGASLKQVVWNCIEI